MDKSPDAFRTISEVAEWLGIQAHVLRFWESKFTQVKPVKRAGGRRYYRPSDMQLLGGIKKLLHDDGLTIKGVQKILREQGATHVSSLSQELCDVAADAAGITETDQKVVPFKASAAPDSAPPEKEASQPVQIEHVPRAPPDDAPPEASGEAPEDPGDKPPVTAPTEGAPPAPPEVAEPEKPEPVAAVPPAPPVEEKPILPSFLHRPPPEPKPEPVVEARKSLVVDAPDPPDESEIPYVRGPLAALAKLDRLGTEQAAKIAPLARQLQTWLDRSGGAGAP